MKALLLFLVTIVTIKSFGQTDTTQPYQKLNEHYSKSQHIEGVGTFIGELKTTPCYTRCAVKDITNLRRRRVDITALNDCGDTIYLRYGWGKKENVTMQVGTRLSVVRIGKSGKKWIRANIKIIQ